MEETIVLQIVLHYDSYENTGKPDVFDEPDMDEYIDNLNDWD